MMSKTYQQTELKIGSATFADKSNEVEPTLVNFRSRVNRVNTKVGQQQFVKYEVGIVSPFVPDCTETCSQTVMNESIKISVNIRKGGDASALQAECLRLMTAAVNNYGLDQGLVPPASATFEE